MTIEWNLILRILAAGLLGGLIGFEREVRAKEAGLRTHFLVALGAALFMVISQFAFNGRFDAARVAAQVVSGIGFIGAGVIIFQKNAVRGVTTAAGLWVAAAIGLACGAGMYDIAAASTLMALMCLETMHFITKRYGEKSVTLEISPIKGEDMARVLELIGKTGAEVRSFEQVHDTVTIQLLIRQRDYSGTITRILECTKDYKVNLS
ncbi:MAG: MgtC/SapB family protein [Bacteroidales bacterium]|nr:MgtC/SapB family protein [Bacteroidales bacterium]